MNSVHSTNVYIMAYERTDFLKECIESVLDNQKYIDFNIFISDSSISNNVSNFINQNYPSIAYIRQDKEKCKTQAEHFNHIISNNNSDYIMLFHDDDVFAEKSIYTLINKIKNNHELGAICPNGFKIEKNIKISKLVNDSIKNNKLFNNNYEFMLRYIKVFEYSVNPFSAYIYRDSFAKKIIRNHSEGMIWSDATYLMKLSSVCKILWLKEPLIYYRIHNNSESSNENIIARLSLIRFVKRNYNVEKKTLKQYKIYFVLRYLLLDKSNSRRRKIYIKFLLINFYYIIKLIPWLIKKSIKKIN